MARECGCPGKLGDLVPSQDCRSRAASCSHGASSRVSAQLPPPAPDLAHGVNSGLPASAVSARAAEAAGKLRALSAESVSVDLLLSAVSVTNYHKLVAEDKGNVVCPGSGGRKSAIAGSAGRLSSKPQGEAVAGDPWRVGASAQPWHCLHASSLPGITSPSLPQKNACLWP